MIELTNINFKYNDKQIINDVNIKINDNELVAFIGKNGSGKSTLAKLISGILKPSNGDIVINDINTKDKKMNIELRKNIGIVFQNPEN